MRLAKMDLVGALQIIKNKVLDGEQPLEKNKVLPVLWKKNLQSLRKRKEKIVKGMKKDKKGFKQRYGDDAESVMYATATKLAKEKK